jgi:hypothetical protein
MTPGQLGKVWPVVSLFLLYYAVNSFLATQGGIADCAKSL